MTDLGKIQATRGIKIRTRQRYGLQTKEKEKKRGGENGQPRVKKRERREGGGP